MLPVPFAPRAGDDQVEMLVRGTAGLAADAGIPPTQPDRVRENWSRSLTSTPDRIEHPRTLPELQAAILRAADTGEVPCVMRGSMHSWSPVAVQDRGTAIDLSGFTFPPGIDPVARTVTVPGSMLLADLYAVLVARGLALDTIPMVTTSTVAGSVATDSHGWNHDDGHLADQIVQLWLVDGRGRSIRIDSDGCWDLTGDKPRLLIAGDAPLRDARHHRGVLGAVYKVMFACRPTFDLELVETAATEMKAFGADRQNLAAFLNRYEHSSVIWFVQQHRVLMRGASRTTKPRKPRTALATRVIDGWIRTDVASAVLRVSRHSTALATMFNAIASTSFPKTRVFRDRWDAILTYLPGHATRAVGLQLMEYGLPVSGLDRALALVGEVAQGFRMPMPMGLRRGGDQVFIEFMWQDGYPGAVEAAQRLEARLVEEFGAGAVPHDGKVFWINPWPRVPEAERGSFLALRAELDPAQLFTNDYMHRYLAGAALAPALSR